MAIAAVPGYLGADFSAASPGLRFGMYLPIWTTRKDQEQEVRERSRKKSHEGRKIKEMLDSQGMDATIAQLTGRASNPVPELWSKNDGTARKSWELVTKLNRSDTACVDALIQRQNALIDEAAGQHVTFRARSVAPFTTGLGNEHPLENGFAFLDPYGLPYLPGSGIKGVVRRAAEELAHRDLFGPTTGWTLPTVWRLFGFEPWLVNVSGEDSASWDEFIAGFDAGRDEIDRYLRDSLVGEDTPSGEESPTYKKLRGKIRNAENPLRTLLKERNLHIRGALSFWDAIPEIKGGKLMVEIMTPHQKHYYQDGQSPHDSGQPNPISFLTVPPDTGFVFHVTCDPRRLGADPTESGHWKKLVEDAFEHAFDWLGFGAKTSVGYGAMARDRSVEAAAERQAREDAVRREQEEMERRRQEAEQVEAARREAELERMSEGQRRIENVRDALDRFKAASVLNREQVRNDAMAAANRLAAGDFEWTDAAERESAAALLEQFYDAVGWYVPGANKKQRVRQEKKRRAAVAGIRGESQVTS